MNQSERVPLATGLGGQMRPAAQDGEVSGRNTMVLGRLPRAEATTGTNTALGCGQSGLGLQTVSHRYGGLVALNSVSVALGPGEVVCLLGPSGCGKSTLLRIAAGLERLQAGEVIIGGRLVACPSWSIPPEQRGIGLVFQDYALFPHLSVLDNVGFGLRTMPAKSRRSRSMEALDQVGMAAQAAAFPHQLSGGQQQRVALARALAPRPSVLLLDEPFSGLDVRLRQQVRDETHAVLRQYGVAALIVTHDPEEAMYLADRIVLMRDGQVVQSGTPTDLYLHPVDSFAACFLGDANRFGGAIRQGAVETVFGPLPVSQACSCCHGDGAQVDVLVRPEGIRLLPAGEETSTRPLATVTATRLLGRSSLVRMRVEGSAGTPVSLEARVAGPRLPPVGAAVALAADPQHIFVFPRAGC